MTKYLSILTGLLLFALLFSMNKCSENAKKASQQETNIAALSDSLKTSVDKYGRMSTEKLVLVMQRDQLMKINGRQGDLINYLQEAVKTAGKNSTSSTAFKAVTNIKAKGPVDSIRYAKPSLVPLPGPTPCPSPIYYGTIGTMGYNARVRASQDTIEIISATTNDFTVTMTTKNSLFKRPSPIIIVKAYNPATGIEQVQSWQPPQPAPKRGLWFTAGFLAGLVVPL